MGREWEFLCRSEPSERMSWGDKLANINQLQLKHFSLWIITNLPWVRAGQDRREDGLGDSLCQTVSRTVLQGWDDSSARS